MRTFIVGGVAFIVVALCVWLWPSDESAGGPERLLISGSTSMVPLLSDLAREFQKSHPSIQIEVQSGHSTNGLEDVRDGVAMVGMIIESEVPEREGVSTHLLSREGVCMVVHASAGVAGLVRAQVADVFEDKVNNWQEIGGKDVRIQVIAPPAQGGPLDVFASHYRLSPGAIRSDGKAENDEELIGAVTSTRGAIGVVSVRSALAARKQGMPIVILPVGGVAPSRETISSGDYVMVRRLSLLTQPKPGDLVTAFIGFTRSPEANEIIRSR